MNVDKFHDRLRDLYLPPEHQFTIIDVPDIRYAVIDGQGNPENNKLDNLRWDTRSNNHLDKIDHGTMPIGSKHVNSKLKEEDIPFIRYWSKIGYSRKDVADAFGVCPQTIQNIVDGKIWSHVWLTG